MLTWLKRRQAYQRLIAADAEPWSEGWGTKAYDERADVSMRIVKGAPSTQIARVVTGITCVPFSRGSALTSRPQSSSPMVGHSRNAGVTTRASHRREALTITFAAG